LVVRTEAGDPNRPLIDYNWRTTGGLWGTKQNACKTALSLSCHLTSFVSFVQYWIENTPSRPIIKCVS
jgi:hypothetical protein